MQPKVREYGMIYPLSLGILSAKCKSLATEFNIFSQFAFALPLQSSQAVILALRAG